MKSLKIRISRLEKMLSGKRPLSKIEQWAIQRQISDLKNESSLEFHWDEKEAVRACTFFPTMLKHWKGEWVSQPLQLSPVQEELIVAPLFGWRKPNGTRRYSQLFYGVARKNGKTTLAAGFGLWGLLPTDHEAGAEIYSVGTKRDQAKIVFKDAKQMVGLSKHLSRRIKTFKTGLHCAEMESLFEPLAAEVRSMDGLNTHFGIFDELHAYPDRHLFDVVKTSMGARRQPLSIIITTAGTDPNSICYIEWDYARRVLNPSDSTGDDNLLVYIAAIDKGDDWEDPAVWWKANPLLDVAIKKEKIAHECKLARETPSYQNTFRRYHLNEWTQQEERWLDMKAWDKCGKTKVPLEDLQGKECYAGIDLSTTIDLTACAYCFPWVDETFLLLMDFWIPEENMLERERRDRVPYRVWVREGYVTPTAGNVVDYRFVRSLIKKRAEQFRIKELPFDPHNAEHLIQQLKDEDGLNCIEHRQGDFSMSGPSKEFERLVLQGRLNHQGNPVLRWNADCVSIKSGPTGLIKPVKPRREASGKRIDGIVAAIMAVGRASLHREKRSVYADRGVLSVEW